MAQYLNPRITLFSFALLVSSICSGQIVGERFRVQTDPTKYPAVKFEWNISGNMQVVMNEGLTNLDNEKYELAATNFKRVIEVLPDFWPAFYYRGVTRRVLNDHQGAKADFLQCIKIENTIVAAHYLLAESYFSLHSLDKAEETFRKVIKIDPTHVLAHYGLGNVRFTQYDLSGAERFYARSTNLDPGFAPGFVMQGMLKIKASGKKNKVALEFLDRGLGADSLISEGLFWRGLIYYDRKDYKAALKDWNTLVSSHPNDPYFLIFRSFLHIELKDFDRAFNDLKKAVLMHQLDVNDYKASETNLDKQIEIQNAAAYVARFSYGMNEKALINFKKGFCYFVMGNAALSNFFLKAAEKHESSATISYMRAVNYDHNSKHDSAYIYYDKALQQDNEIVDAHKKRAIYRYQLKNWEGAYFDLNEMLRLDPTSHFTHRIRGFIRAHEKDYSGAIVDLTKYLESDSLDAEVWKTRGYCRQEMKDTKGKLEDYRQSLRINPSDEVILNELIDGYRAIADTTNFRSFHQEFVKTYSGDERFRYLLIEYFIEIKNWTTAIAEVQKNRVSLSQESQTEEQRKRRFSILARYDGLICFEQQDYEQAVQHFTLSLKLYEYNANARFWRGKSYLALGLYKESIDDFQFLVGIQYPDAKEMLKEARKLSR